MIRRPLVAAALVGALAASVLVAAPASAASARVAVSSSLGAARAAADSATTLTVSGTGFQSVAGGFGGVYVVFGWVDDDWRPSSGGVVGADYGYIPDSQSKDNKGYMRFVSFPGGETESSAQAVMSPSGSWSVDLVVPGATITTGATGSSKSVDCRTVRCGVITIGAHGVKNANNETFTPVTFASGSSGASTATGTASGAASSGTSSGGSSQKKTDAAAQPVGELRVGLASGAVEPGSALAFTARGFSPGEQVVATVDNGAAAVGPMTAGTAGDVAGVIALPVDLVSGTHLLTVTGAGSGGVAESELTVAASAPAVSAGPTSAVPAWLSTAMVIAILAALALLIANVAARIVRAVRSRRRAAEAGS